MVERPDPTRPVTIGGPTWFLVLWGVLMFVLLAGLVVGEIIGASH